MQQTIAILDFGSQYTQLIARRVRELNVYCEIMPFSKNLELGDHIKGVIYSGSPFSVHDKTSPIPDIESVVGKVPLLTVCYGAQFAAKYFGGEVIKSTIREYGRAMLTQVYDNPLMEGISTPSQVWMSHGDTISELPKGFDLLCETIDVKVAGFYSKDKNVYGLQFHPEVYHTSDGLKLLSNFVVNICACDQSFTSTAFVDETIGNLKNIVGKDKVILGLSGGVDSSVAAVLLDKAIGKNLTCIFVDNGLLRKDEYSQVLDSYKNMGLNVIGVNAADRFYNELAGKSDPEEKRKTIGRVFIEVFEEESKKIDGVKWLAQGTIYPDVIESVSVNGPSVTIKSHHNVGGLPARMNLKVVEPLRLLFKDEVRRVGKSLDMDPKILGRHPFPGPGLAIRILGDITAEKVKMLQAVDAIFIDGLRSNNLYDSVWQAGAILLPVQSVGVMGDERTYENAVALRAVSSTDGMTADWCHLPYEVLGKISNDIINKVNGINRVVYDISSKPPATIEWE